MGTYHLLMSLVCEVCNYLQLANCIKQTRITSPLTTISPPVMMPMHPQCPSRASSHYVQDISCPIRCTGAPGVCFFQLEKKENSHGKFGGMTVKNAIFSVGFFLGGGYCRGLKFSEKAK